ncbi:MAG: Flp family type IVb pilin [Gemmatimonadales bacterium]
MAPRRAGWKDHRGQGMVEYAVLLGLVAIGLVLALLLLRGGVGNVFGHANQAIEASSPGSADDGGTAGGAGAGSWGGGSGGSGGGPGGGGPSGGPGCGDGVGGGQGGGCHTGQQ